MYVLFKTAAEKNQACRRGGGPFNGRQVKIIPAPEGSYQLNADETGFVHEDLAPANTGTEQTEPAGRVFNEEEFPALGSARVSAVPSVPAPDPTRNLDDHDANERAAYEKFMSNWDIDGKQEKDWEEKTKAKYKAIAEEEKKTRG